MLYLGEVVDMIETRGKEFPDYDSSELDRLFDDIPTEIYTHAGGGSGTSIILTGLCTVEWKIIAVTILTF